MRKKRPIAKDTLRFEWLIGSLRRFALAAGPGLLIILAGLAAYANSFRGPFIFDDLYSIHFNQTIHHLWPLTEPADLPGNGATVQCRPILNVSLAINYALGREEVWGYHAFNLAIHLLVGLVLFGVVRRTLENIHQSTGDLESGPTQSLSVAPKRTGEFVTPIASTGQALAIALLWTVHPLTTKAVTYVIQRAESMMALCYLLTLYCVIRGVAANTSSTRRIGWYAAAAASCLLGTGCKEVIVTAPLVVLLYDRQFLAGSFAGAIRRRWGLYAGLAASWLPLTWLSLTAEGRTGGFGTGVSPWAYGLTQCQAIVTYLRLTFWPDRLVFFYGTDVAGGIADVWPVAMVLALLLSATVWGLIRRHWAGFLGASFFLILSPSSSVVPLMETVAEHRVYLPMAAVVALAVVCGYWALAFAVRWLGGQVPENRRRRVTAALAVAGVAALAVGLALQRNLGRKASTFKDL